MFREARNILFTEDGNIYLPSNLILCAACDVITHISHFC